MNLYQILRGGRLTREQLLAQLETDGDYATLGKPAAKFTCEREITHAVEKGYAVFEDGAYSLAPFSGVQSMVLELIIARGDSTVDDLYRLMPMNDGGREMVQAIVRLYDMGALTRTRRKDIFEYRWVG